jgi:pSer/pThr/pTyr-binding forkhead associated (FHA) protein
MIVLIMTHVLVVYQGQIEMSYDLLPGRNVLIGRTQDNHIIIDNMGVSRNHARIESYGDSWSYIDGGSNNGSYLRGRRIDKHVLKDGDEIVLGKHVIRFIEHGPAPILTKRHAKTGQSGLPEMTMMMSEQALALPKNGSRALLIQRGGQQVRVSLIKRETIIGSKGDVVAKGFLIGRAHAVISGRGIQHWLECHAWFRVPTINGVRARGSHLLKHGDVIVLGSLTGTYDSPT